MNNPIFEQSLKSRNEEAIQKLANVDSLKEWANSAVTPTPLVKEKPPEKLSIKMKLLLRNLLV